VASIVHVAAHSESREVGELLGANCRWPPGAFEKCGELALFESRLAGWLRKHPLRHGNGKEHLKILDELN
jgi:hypothetical protein